MLNAITRQRKPVPASPVLARDPFFHFVDRFFSDFAWPTQTLFDGDSRQFVPAVDIVETENSFVATADLPGLTKDDIELSLEDGVLSISGERTFKNEDKGDGKSFRRIERSYGSFVRTVDLPKDVRADKVKAAFKNGILEVRMPKTEEAKAKEIKVKVE